MGRCPHCVYKIQLRGEKENPLKYLTGDLDFGAGEGEQKKFLVFKETFFVHVSVARNEMFSVGF